MVAACYAAWNEAGEIEDSIRSVKAYVDRFVVVDCAFTANPAPGPVQSTDGTRAAVERACAGVPLTYIEPGSRLEQHVARDLYLREVPQGEWLLVIDGDEILYGPHVSIVKLLASLPAAGAVQLRVLTNAVLVNGMAPDVTPEAYATAPIISTVGWQPRLLRNADGLRHRPGWENVGWRTNSQDIVAGVPSDAAWVVNRHVRQSYEGYQADYAWQTIHRLPPTTEGEYA